MNKWTKLALVCGSFAVMPLLMAPRNGSGTYTLPAGNPVVSGTTISSTVHNNTMSDIATALTGSLTKDGQTTSTANQPMGGFRHTNVGNPTLRSQYGTVDNIQDGDYVVLSSVAGTNTITGALSPTPTAYVAGMQVVLIPANTNTGATTLNISSIGALDVQKWVSGAQANVIANDLRAGVPAYLVLDTGADDWILLNPNSGNLGDVTAGALTVTTLNGAAVPVGANPTGTIGLAAVNGSAATFLRSDGAPALSQAIAPTWTAQHIFSSSYAGAGSSATLLSSNLPMIEFNDANSDTDDKLWQMFANTDQFILRVITDDRSTASATVLQVDRTNAVVDRVTFPAEAERAFVMGTDGGFTSPLAKIRSTGGGRGALAANSSITGSPSVATVTVQNELTAGDNSLIEFRTEANAGTVRGLIDYNRAGTAVRYITTSDMRLKKNFKPAPSARSVIECVQIESYDWKDTGYHVDHGLVAQRVNKCAPYAVKSSTDPAVTWGVDPSKLVPALIKYVQEQDARISELERRMR